MQNTPISNRVALEQRSAQLEQVLRQLFAALGKIPLQRWQWLIAGLLVLSLSHSLARLFWLVIPTPTIPPATLTLVGSNTSATGGAGGSINIDQLKTLTPFGKVEVVVAPPPEAAPVVTDTAADTQLNLVLRAVISSSDEKSARAVIASGSKEELYGIGDTLPVGNNVTLAKVFDVRVILNNNGKFESLSLYKDDPNAPVLGSMSYAPAPQPANNNWGASNGYQQGPNPAVRAENNAAVRNADSGESAMAQMSKTLSDVVAMSIHRENGKVIGYKIRPGRNAEMFNSLGLQTDDIVTAVNGVPLSSPGKIMEIYKSMGNATSANLEIKRGGSTVNLDVVLN